jgi:hypothetical protein
VTGHATPVTGGTALHVLLYDKVGMGVIRQPMQFRIINLRMVNAGEKSGRQLHHQPRRTYWSRDVPITESSGAPAQFAAARRIYAPSCSAV